MSLDTYNTPSTSTVYINGFKIDDIFRVDWSDKTGKTPLYGWGDTQYRTVANGREVVTGSLILHYRWPGYLFTALKNQGNGVNGSITTDEDRDNLRTTLNNLKQGTVESRVQTLMKISEGGTPEEFDKHALLLQSLFMNDTLDQSGILIEKGKTLPPSQLPVSDGPFAINIVYGNPDSNSFYVEKIIQGVHFLGETQVISASAAGGGDMSSSGSPIFEVYTFLARRVDEKIHDEQPRQNLGLVPVT